MWDRIKSENLLFVLVDFQEKFFPIMDRRIVDIARKNLLLAVKMFAKLNIPMIGTDHYRKGLGLTDQSVLKEWMGPEITDKITFSCCGSDLFLKNLEQHKKPLVVIAGLETHICVLQTTLDLLKRGLEVIVLKDACLSSTKLRYENGLELMKDAGAKIVNTESLIFYLLQRADTPEFKYLVKLLKDT